MAVPSSGWNSSPSKEEEDKVDDDMGESEHTYLIFDPAVSPHFELVLFLQKFSIDDEVGVHTYSSETRAWTDRGSERGQSEEGGESQQLGSFGAVASTLGSAFVNGMLHLTVYHIQRDRELIVAIDGEGKTRRVICWPEDRACCWSEPAFVGQSQGRLHCMSEHLEGNSAWITFWVLQDYDTQEWVMKHSISSLQLFGKSKCLVQFDYSVVGIHPDRNLVFIVQRSDRKLMSYDMDSKEVHALHTLEGGYEFITPYVPYFSESTGFTSVESIAR
uniref:F-box protein At3g26010-like beta-propeller domain-containing protein n=1 Tax=Arundo donax TaxID=35708 RepID=A0A0A9D035_ARUDO